MKLCTIQSGLLEDIQEWVSDKTLPNSDLYLHTWKIKGNFEKLNEVEQKYSNFTKIKITTEKYSDKFVSLLPTFSNGLINLSDGFFQNQAFKKFAGIYSFYKAVQSIPSIDEYNVILKAHFHLLDFNWSVPVDLNEEHLPYAINARQCYPLLESFKAADCVYARTTYRSYNQRIFYTSPQVIKKVFLKDERLFAKTIGICFDSIYRRTGILGFEGDLLWQELFNFHNVPVLEDGSIVEAPATNGAQNITFETLKKLEI